MLRDSETATWRAKFQRREAIGLFIETCVKCSIRQPSELSLDKQGEALKACFREDWSASSDRKAKRILLPVRNLQTWIGQNILVVLKDAPFDKKDVHLVVIAGSCVDCSKQPLTRWTPRRSPTGGVA